MQGVRLPSKGSARNGKIKWLEVFTVLPCGMREEEYTEAGYSCTGSSTPSLHIWLFYLESEWISYSTFPNLPFSHFRRFTNIVIHSLCIKHRGWHQEYKDEQDTFSDLKGTIILHNHSFPWSLTTCKFLKSKDSCLKFPDGMSFYFTNILTI